MQTQQKEVRLSTVAAWAVWALGLIGVGLGLVFGPNVGHIGIALCLLGTTMTSWTFFRDLEHREHRAFELGCDHEKALMKDVRQLR